MKGRLRQARGRKGKAVNENGGGKRECELNGGELKEGGKKGILEENSSMENNIARL